MIIQIYLDILQLEFIQGKKNSDIKLTFPAAGGEILVLERNINEAKVEFIGLVRIIVVMEYNFVYFKL